MEQSKVEHEYNEFDSLPITPAPVAKFVIGQVVKHRHYPFRGVIFDVDAQFNNSDEWYESIPENVRPNKNQPFYHLLAENDQTTYVAYVSEQNLIADLSGEPVSHPAVEEMFTGIDAGLYQSTNIVH